MGSINIAMDIITTPLYFVRSGYINSILGYLLHMSGDGDYWSLSATSKHGTDVSVPSAYFLNFATHADSSGGPDNRWDSFPLRCLVIGGGSLTYDGSDHITE